MFHLVVCNTVNANDTFTMHDSRYGEYTDDYVLHQFDIDSVDGRGRIVEIPAVLMEEGTGGEVARVGQIISIKKPVRDLAARFVPDPNMGNLSNSQIYELRNFLEIDDFEFNRNHWSIKNVDLFSVLYKSQPQVGPTPKVFALSQSAIRSRLVSVMMPFDGASRPVYDDLKAGLEASGYECERADDMWVNDHIMQDVIELICTASVVVCDLSGRNPNVLYEAGIAHTLGKDVVIITRSIEDVPFDLRAIRCLTYLNNGEGRAKMVADVVQRVQALTS